MTTLFLMHPPHLPANDGSAHGQFREGTGLVPPTDDLIAFECELDDWAGELLVEAIGPWFLATEQFRDAISAAGLTGLETGNVAAARYSAHGKVLAGLGELFASELPEFRIAAGRTPIDVRPLDGRADGYGGDDDLRYEGWAGEDFSSSVWGPVVTERAVKVVEAMYPPVLPPRRWPSWSCHFQTVTPR